MELGALQFPAETPGGMCSVFAAVLAQLSHNGDRDGWHGAQWLDVVGQDGSTLQMSGRGHRETKAERKKTKHGGKSQFLGSPCFLRQPQRDTGPDKNKNGQQIPKTAVFALTSTQYKKEPQRLPRIEESGEDSN